MRDIADPHGRRLLAGAELSICEPTQLAIGRALHVRTAAPAPTVAIELADLSGHDLKFPSGDGKVRFKGRSL